MIFNINHLNHKFKTTYIDYTYINFLCNDCNIVGFYNITTGIYKICITKTITNIAGKLSYNVFDELLLTCEEIMIKNILE